MLVVTRKVGQRVFVAPGTEAEVVITIISVCNGQVRVGIKAPPSVSIKREEIMGEDYATGRKGE
jgi:carbon storage regulator CsrA